MKVISKCLSLTFLYYTDVCQLDLGTLTVIFTPTTRTWRLHQILFRPCLIERAQPEGIDHPTWEDLCNAHASSSLLSGANSRHWQLNSSIRLTSVVLPLSCKITTLHNRSHVVSNWNNYFLSKVSSKLLMTAEIGSQPSCDKCSSTYYRTIVPLSQYIPDLN